jgi:hypothetical protein
VNPLLGEGRKPSKVIAATITREAMNQIVVWRSLDRSNGGNEGSVDSVGSEDGKVVIMLIALEMKEMPIYIGLYTYHTVATGRWRGDSTLTTNFRNDNPSNSSGAPEEHTPEAAQ